MAVLTAAYDLTLWELDGVQDTALAHSRAFHAGVDVNDKWEGVETMAGYVAEVEAGLIPGQSRPRAPDSGFLPAEEMPPWSEWRTAAEAAWLPLITVVPVRILQDRNNKTLVETV